MTNSNYNLEDRTAKFSINIIKFSKIVPRNYMTEPIIIQMIRSATSIRANYCEASHAESKKDFKHKIGICRKEAKETKYWLNILKEAIPQFISELEILLKESTELNLIFSSIYFSEIKKNF